MNWVDYALLALVALSGIHGLRLGAVMQVFSFGGFFLGLFLGAVIAPSLAGLASGVGKPVVALAVVFGLATVLGGVGRLVGAHSSRLLQRFHLGPVDAACGVAVAVLATLVATWLVADMLQSSRYTALNSALTHSRIVRALDNVLPPVPTVFAQVETFLASEGFPVVFSGLPPETAAPVALPGNAAVRAAYLASAPSTVQVAGAACGDIQEGSGFVVAPGIVVTNAHVVAGMPRPVVIDSSGRHLAAALLFDPDLDIAVLRAPGLDDPSLRVAATVVGRGTTGVVLGYPGGGPLAYGAAGVAAAFQATGLDIYGRSTTVREIYELDAVVRPGNSGGPLVVSGSDGGLPVGTVIGVVFARSTANGQIGYALALPAVEQDVAKAEHATATVGTGGCAP